MAKEISGEDIFLALLSYLGILFLIPLLIKKDNLFIHQHAKQGFILFIAGFLVGIPLIGWLWGLFLFVCWIIAIVNVFQSKYWKIPLIGNIAAKIKI